MMDKTDPNQAAAPFRAVLSPYRSLGPRGFAVLMAAVCAINFAVGLTFWALGAWPIFLFCGLDVALIYLAFRINYRAGRAYETIDLTPDLLTVTSVDPDGRRRAFEFNPYWVRVDLSEHHDGRTELSLAHHSRRLVFAHCLTDDERRTLASVLSAEIRRVRRAVGF